MENFARLGTIAAVRLATPVDTAGTERTQWSARDWL